MINVIVSQGCSHCDTQKEIMERFFFDDEFRIVEAGTDEFNKFAKKTRIEAVPYIIITRENGSLAYGGVGIHEEEKLRKLASGSKGFCLREYRSANSS